MFGGIKHYTFIRQRCDGIPAQEFAFKCVSTFVWNGLTGVRTACDEIRSFTAWIVIVLYVSNVLATTKNVRL